MQLRILGLPFVFVVLACSKAAPTAASSPPAFYGGIPAQPSAPPPPRVDAASGSVDFESDDVTGEVTVASVESVSLDRRAERRARRSAQAEVASPAPRPAEATKEERGRTSGAEPADERPDLDVDARYVVYVANMQISVFNLAEALGRAEALPETYGGYIASMTTNQIVLRIPSPKLKAAMAELATFGVVEYRVLQAQEVTAEFVDLEGRIRALEETRTQLLVLLGQARSVPEALQVREALDRVNSELEVLKGRIRQLGNQIAYSTLTVTLVERGPFEPTPSSNDPFPWVDQLGVEATEWK